MSKKTTDLIDEISQRCLYTRQFSDSKGVKKQPSVNLLIFKHLMVALRLYEKNLSAQ
jgi:hypothetical protein